MKLIKAAFGVGAMLTQPQMPQVSRFAFCINDFDCELPYRCCDYLMLNICCFDGGVGARLPRKHSNASFPPYPVPIPA